MRPTHQVEIIEHHLKILEDLRNDLEQRVSIIQCMLEKGRHWIDERDMRFSFTELKCLLIQETAHCIQQCLNSTGDNVRQNFTKKTDETLVHGACSSSPNQVTDSKEKISDATFRREKESGTYDVKIINIMKELKILTDTMSNLRLKFDNSVNVTNLLEKKMDEILQTIKKQEETVHMQIVKDANDKFKMNADGDSMAISSRIQQVESRLDKLATMLAKCNHSADVTTDINNKMDGMLQKMKNQEDKIKSLTLKQKLNEENHVTKLGDISDSMFLDSSRLQEVEKSQIRLTSIIDTMKVDVSKVSSDVANNKHSYSLKSDALQKQIIAVEKRISDLMLKVNGSETVQSAQNALDAYPIVAFTVGLTEKVEVQKDNVVKYDRVIVNAGDGYNIRNGLFTSPVSGYYVFLVNVHSANNKFVNLDLYQNSDYKVSMFAHYPRMSCSGGNSVILHLNRNDRVTVRASLPSILHSRPNDVLNTFSGCLLFAD